MFPRKMIYKQSISVKIFSENILLPTKLTLQCRILFLCFLFGPFLCFSFFNGFGWRMITLLLFFLFISMAVELGCRQSYTCVNCSELVPDFRIGFLAGALMETCGSSRDALLSELYNSALSQRIFVKGSTMAIFIR